MEIYTQIANLLNPDKLPEWARGTDEAYYLNYGILTAGPVNYNLNSRFTSGADIGTIYTTTSFKPTLIEMERQRDGVVPTPNEIDSRRINGTYLNRVGRLSIGALASQVSSFSTADIVNHIQNVITRSEVKDMHTALVNSLRGSLGVAELSDHVITDTFSQEQVLDAIDIWGENSTSFELGGVFYTHSKVVTELKKLDLIDYIKPSDASPSLPTYMGRPVIVDNTLAKTGANGKVYELYLMLPSSVQGGRAPKVAAPVGTSTIWFKEDNDTNLSALTLRNRFTLLPNGVSWIKETDPDSTEDISGPTNAELANPANWACPLTHTENFGIVQYNITGF